MVSKDGIGGDAWILAFNEAEQKLIDGANRKVVLSGSSVKNIGRLGNPHIFYGNYFSSRISIFNIKSFEDASRATSRHGNN